MSPNFLVFVLVCLSVHACKCNARFLGVFHKEITTKEHSFTKDIHAVESKNVGAIDNMNQKHLGTLFSEKHLLITQVGGNELITGYASQKDLPQKTKIKDIKRQERTLVGSAGESSDDVEESAEEESSKEKDITDHDIEEMDYAQPHRKPPIHNEKN